VIGDDRQATLPFARGSDTSRAAAESMAGGAARRQRAAVLTLFRTAGDKGLTCDEAEVICGGRHQSISARVHELAADGAILKTAERRLTRSNRRAAVYRVRR